MDRPLSITFQKRIIAIISIAIALLISFSSEFHNHEDGTVHSDCPACVQINHPAVITELFSPLHIQYQLSSDNFLSCQTYRHLFFSPQLNPRAPPTA